MSLAKRQRHASVGGQVLAIILDWLYQDVPNPTTSNILLAYPPLAKGHEVWTNYDDVTVENATFFLSLNRVSLIKLCYAAASKGDLEFLKTFMTYSAITERSYAKFRQFAVKNDSLEMLTWLDRFKCSSSAPLVYLAVNKGAIRILECVATEKDLVNCPTAHSKTINWVAEKYPDVLKVWKTKPSIARHFVIRGDLDALKKIHSLGFAIGYIISPAMLYNAALRWERRSIMKWLYDTVGPVTPYSAAFPLYYKADEKLAGKTFKLFCDHHGVEFTNYRRISKNPAQWISTSSWKLSEKEFFSLLKWEHYQEIAIRGHRIPWHIDNFEMKCRVSQAMTSENLSFLLSQGLPEAWLPDLFCLAIRNHPYELCKFLYTTYTKYCTPYWPTDGATVFGLHVQSSEKWDWLDSILPIGDAILPFTQFFLEAACYDSFEWALPRVPSSAHESLMSTVVAVVDATDDFRFLQLMYRIYPHLPKRFRLKERWIYTKEAIQFLVDNKFPLPRKFRPNWPDDFEFLKQNFLYFGWHRSIESTLRRTWSEENYQLYLAQEETMANEHWMQWL